MLIHLVAVEIFLIGLIVVQRFELALCTRLRLRLCALAAGDIAVVRTVNEAVCNACRHSLGI